MTVQPTTPTGLSDLPSSKIRTVTTVHLASWTTLVLIVSITTVMVQGIFYNLITEMVVGRTFVLFRILPFNLYPSDLLILPLLMLSTLAALSQLAYRHTERAINFFFMGLSALMLIGVALFVYLSGSVRQAVPTLVINLTLLTAFVGLVGVAVVVLVALRLRVGAGRRLQLLIVWWLICLVGIATGLAADNPDLTADVRIYLMRSMIPIAIFYLALQANLDKLFAWIERIGIVLAVYLSVSSLLVFADVSLLPSSGLYGGIALLFAYVLVLVQVLVVHVRSRSKLYTLVLLAFSIISTLAKPLIAAFVVCNLLVLFFVRLGHFRVRISWLKTLVLLFLVILLLVGVLQFSGGWERAANYVLDNYLKQDRAVQDLSGNRFAIWSQGLEQWRQSPLIGKGFGFLLSAEVIELDSGRSAYREVVGAHNILVEMLYKVGVVGVLLLTLVAFTWLRRVYRTFQLISSKAIFAKYMLAVVIVFTITTMSMYGSHIAHPMGAFLFWFCLGIEAALATKIKQDSQINLACSHNLSY